MQPKKALEDKLRASEAELRKAIKYLAMVKEGEHEWPEAKKVVARIRARIARIKNKIKEGR